MKTYNEMANSALNRIKEQECNNKNRRKIIARTVTPIICVCLTALLGLSLWQSGLLGKEPVQPDYSASHTTQQGGTEGHGVSIPPIELPDTLGAISDMRGVLVYQGRIYTQADFYFDNDAKTVSALLGEHLGYAKGNLDEWSSQEKYAAEFASSCSGDVYTVKGYDPTFRLCVVSAYEDENGKTGKTIMFLENLNGITLNTGADLFETRLNLAKQWKTMKFQTHEDWNQNIAAYKTPELSQEQINAFLQELNKNTVTEVPDIYDNNLEQAHLIFSMEDGTRVELRLFEGGYIGYQEMGYYFVKMPGENFDAVFTACK